MKKIKDNKWAFWLTISFCVLMGWIILFKMSFSITALVHTRRVNLIPFYYEQETPFHLYEVVMNVLAFIPLGLLLMVLKCRFTQAVLLGFGYSLFLEGMQFLLKVGVFDITDLITNTLGVVMGALVYMALAKLFKRTDVLDKVIKIIATVGTVLLTGLMLLFLINDLFYRR